LTELSAVCRGLRARLWQGPRLTCAAAGLRCPDTRAAFANCAVPAGAPMRSLVAIPVFNEERYLARVLSEVRRYTGDVLVIDDGSTDATPDLLRDLRPLCVIRHSTNLGYGRSLIDAFAFAAGRGYDWVVTMDCDDQHEPARIPDFLAAARRGLADIIS